MKNIHPFILAGGYGQRLWPLSTQSYPKQFLPLSSEYSLLQETIKRLDNSDFNASSIICNLRHSEIVSKQLQEINRPYERIILEPETNGTAFTIGLAALSTIDKDPQGNLLILPCDHYIEDPSVFLQTINTVIESNHSGDSINMFGIKPDRPETAYGYFYMGSEFKILKFEEKPDHETAQRYIKDGNYFWNSGIYLCSAAHIVKELRQHAPEIYNALSQSWAQTNQAPEGIISLSAAPLAKDKRLSIDYAVIEKTQNIKGYILDTTWSDLGSWQSLMSHIKYKKNSSRAFLRILYSWLSKSYEPLKSRKIR